MAWDWAKVKGWESDWAWEAGSVLAYDSEWAWVFCWD
jgi:hypothetical protein